MRVRVRFHEQLSDDFERWAEFMASFGENGKALHALLVRVLIDRFEETSGFIPEARMATVLGQPAFRWEFQPDVWIVYRIRDRRTWLRSTRDVIIVGIETPLSSGS